MQENILPRENNYERENVIERFSLFTNRKREKEHGYE